MGEQVAGEELLLQECLVAKVTFELFLARVIAHVSLELVLDTEGFVAKVTLEVTQSGLVTFQMSFIVVFALENFIAGVTLVGLIDVVVVVVVIVVVDQVEFNAVVNFSQMSI